MLIKKDSDTIKAYFEDSSNLKGGHAEEVVIPEDIEELSEFLKYAFEKKVPVTISGGGTSTTGSRVPFGGVVLSMERFNKIIDISKDRMSALVQAGVMVEDFKEACEREGLFYASHPTERTAMIGGTVATNASGAMSFKYGPTRRLVKYLKMVFANGEVFELKRGDRIIRRHDSIIELASGNSIEIPMPTYKMPNVKNSAGYFAKDGMDLIDLFIGQEGTLSVIVETELSLDEKPSRVLSAFVFFQDETDAWSFSREVCKRKAKMKALSIEYFDSNSVKLLRNKNRNVPNSANAAIFFEQDTSGKAEDEIMNEWTDMISKYNASLDDTWVAMTEKEARDFVDLRHSIPEMINDIVRKRGYCKPNTDIAVPEDSFFEMMNFYKDIFRKEGLEHLIFGHIGDCHVHVNILPKSEEELELAKRICFSFAKKGVELGGTISAEHGIGKTRHKYLEEMYGEAGILEMARIKKALDPNCILGLDNIFPKEILASV